MNVVHDGACFIRCIAEANGLMGTKGIEKIAQNFIALADFPFITPEVKLWSENFAQHYTHYTVKKFLPACCYATSKTLQAYAREYNHAFTMVTSSSEHRGALSVASGGCLGLCCGCYSCRERKIRLFFTGAGTRVCISKFY